MKITVSLDDELATQVVRIAVEQGTSVTRLVQNYPEDLVAGGPAERKRRELETLEDSFSRLQIKIGKKTWRREDLYDRS
jgi:hypothetical protein